MLHRGSWIIFSLIAAIALLPSADAEGADFVRGDATRDGSVDITDPISMLAFLFMESYGPGELCPDALDANDDGEVDVSDPIMALTFLFIGSQRIPQPFPFCGTDPIDDELFCGSEGICPPHPRGRLVGQGLCKSGSGGATSSQECAEYSFAGGVLSLRHVNAAANCCGIVSVVVTVEGRTIALTETENYERTPCDCDCLIDIEYEVVDLTPGPYEICITTKDWYRELEFSVDLSLIPSGSYCEDRHFYPWGE